MTKKKTTQHISMNVHIADINTKDNSDFDKLPPHQIFSLVIDYPLDTPATYEIKTGRSGMGLNKLVGEIGKAYKKTYDVEDAWEETEEDPDPPFGIWGHDLSDLYLEQININYKTNKITLDVGS